MTLARNVATVGTATLLSRLLGFIRDVGIAAVLGAGALSDAYFAALQIPNLFRRLLAEGALNSAFVPMWLRIKDESGEASARRFGADVLGTMTIALCAVALLCMAFAPTVSQLLVPGFSVGGVRYALTVDYIRLSIPYIVIAGMVAVAVSILNAEGRVGAASYGLVVFNGVLIAAVVIVLLFGESASAQAGAILSAAIVAAGVGQLILVGGAMWRLRNAPLRPRFTLTPQTRQFFAMAVPGVVAGGTPQLKLMAGAMVASSSQASVSWLYYANRLYELPLGVASIAIASVLVPLIAASVRNGDKSDISGAQSRTFEIALGLALPAAVAFAVLAEPIVGGLFQRGAFGPRDTTAVAAALTAICAGLPGHVLEKVFGAISFAHEDTRTPMLAALCGLAAAVAGSLLLFPRYGHVGIAAAIAVSGWVGATIMAAVLVRRGWLSIDGSAWRRLPRIVAATLAMAAAIFAAKSALMGFSGYSTSAVVRALVLGLLVAIGLAVYLAAIQLLGVARLSELRAALRDRF